MDPAAEFKRVGLYYIAFRKAVSHIQSFAVVRQSKNRQNPWFTDEVRLAEMGFDHHHENNPAFVPPANPADAPAINAIADGDFSEEPQKLSSTCMATQPWLRG